MRLTVTCAPGLHLLLPLDLQRMGLGALRLWAFNDAFPYAPGKYSDAQGRGLTT